MPSDLKGHELGGGLNGEIHGGGGFDGARFHLGDHVVVVHGIVVVQQDVFGSGGVSFFKCHLPCRVAPASMTEVTVHSIVFFRGVLGVVENQVGVAGESLNVRVQIFEVLGVSGKGEYGAGLALDLLLDPVAEASTWVVEGKAADEEFV